MHIPDGFIPLGQCAIYFALALPFVVKSISWARKEMEEASMPLFATLAAGIFAIQAMNVPIPWGTSGHMVGGVLAAILLGSPYAGVLLLTIVLVIQALLFADGGVTALGANILDMGVISTFVGFYTYRGLKGRLGIFGASFAGGWLGLFVSALAVAVELAIAGTFPLAEGLMFMGLYHAVIGLIAEGMITSVVVTTVARVSPELFPELAGEVAA
ncbi:MAG: cobalt transporter CbiM [Euryarchaeota archaeon]|nr:cobalt transporter CbiM [Euryarchaeota archaeon]